MLATAQKNCSSVERNMERPKLNRPAQDPEDYQRIFEERVGESLICPDTGKPYLFFPISPIESIFLADAQPQGIIRKCWLVIECGHTEKG